VPERFAALKNKFNSSLQKLSLSFKGDLRSFAPQDFVNSVFNDEQTLQL